MLLAKCGREAVRIVRSNSIHLAILDMHMPDMSGLDTLGVIRHEVGAEVPAILVSRDTSKELQLKALAARFATYMSKPVDLTLLRRVVADIVLRHYPGGRRSPLAPSSGEDSPE
jgi:DNA-binding response OmpR family regulator